MVIVLPAMVATAGLELVYVIKPLLFVVGATRAKVASPNVFAGTSNPVRVVVILFTCRVEVINPDTKTSVLA